MNKKALAKILFALLLALMLGLQTASFVEANPLVPPVIRVDSPQNNRIYSSGEIWLNFTRLRIEEMENTSITYSLDGNEEVATNGSTRLSGLSAGSHGVAFYSKLSDSEDYGFLITKIYFSVNYSTQWVTFAAVTSVGVAVVLLALFVTRYRLADVLKREKTPKFWAGLILLVFGSSILSLIIGGTVHEYLFPVYSSRLVINYTFQSTVFSLVLVGIGSLLMGQASKGKHTD